MPGNIEVRINGQQLGRVTDYRYLGITYDFNLKWDIHVSNIIRKTKYFVYVFYRLKLVLSKKQLMQIYYGLFNSIAIYAIIGWGGLYDAALDPLQQLQDKIIKIIGVNDQEKPLEIRQIFVLNCIVYVYEKLKSTFLNNTKNTRFKSISLPKLNLTIGQRYYDYYAKKYFNELPNELKTLNVSDKLLKKKA